MRRTTTAKLVVSTANPGKLREIRSLLGDVGLALVSLTDEPEIRLPEEGDDYATNAAAKALAVADQLGLWAVADDSGLEVEALDGAPGPRSARFGGPDLDDAGRVRALLAALEGVPREDRGARFVCLAALAIPGEAVQLFRGECRGRLRETPSGQGGFGYDPIFQPEARDHTLAELDAEEKQRLSHRAAAFRALAVVLKGRLAAR